MFRRNPYKKFYTKQRKSMGLSRRQAKSQRKRGVFMPKYRGKR